MLAMFPYHNAKVFDFDEWHIKNAQTSPGASVFVKVLDLWVMPLFFTLSGVAVYHSLKHRTLGEFIKERTLRITLHWIGPTKCV
jgi:glucan biosynthesis protein C